MNNFELDIYNLRHEIDWRLNFINIQKIIDVYLPKSKFGTLYRDSNDESKWGLSVLTFTVCDSHYMWLLTRNVDTKKIDGFQLEKIMYNNYSIILKHSGSEDVATEMYSAVSRLILDNKLIDVL